MFSLSHLLIGLILIAAGVAGLKYTFQILNFTGRQDWIEDHLGGGTTHAVYKLFFLLVVAIGILLALGLIDPVLNVFLSPLRSAFSPS